MVRQCGARRCRKRAASSRSSRDVRLRKDPSTLSGSESWEGVMADECGGDGCELPARRRGVLGGRWAVRAVVLTALALAGALHTQAASANGRGFSWTPSKTEPYATCGHPTPGHAACLAVVVPPYSAGSLTRIAERSRSGLGESGLHRHRHRRRLRPRGSSLCIQPSDGITGNRPDGWDRRRLQRSRRGIRSGRISLAVRATGLHHRERLLQEGQPDGRHDQLPSDECRLVG